MTAWFGWGDLNPLSWLGDAAAEAVGQGWTSAMVASWSSAMWILDTAFTGIDAFTAPDLSAGGPMREAYAYTFGIAALVAVGMAFAQIGVAAFRRDAGSLARVLVGTAQFAAVWVGYVAVAAALVSAASGLTDGLLHGLLGVDDFAGYQPGNEWPRDVTDTVTATVLGICSWLLIWPAAIMYLLVAVVREAGLLILAATSPIAAGGLLSDTGKVWFWKSLRWFVAALLISPLSVLVLGIGNQIAQGVTSGAGRSTATAVGTAVVSSVIVLVGAICPMILFRLLAFVDPGTSSGIALRGAMASHGGVHGLLTRNGERGGSAASSSDAFGRSAGEMSADGATAARFGAAAKGAGAAGAVVGAVVAAGRAAQGAVAMGSDVLSTSGVGHSHPYYPPYDPPPQRRPAPVARRVPVSEPPEQPNGSDAA